MSDKKRGPGRPPRRIVPPIATKGIVQIPKSTDNVVEFHYYDPLVLKQLYSLFKNLKAGNIYFKFMPDTFDILTNDHNGNRLMARIDCDKVTHYYCKKMDKPLYLAVDRNNIQNIFLNINKEIDNIVIIYETIDNMLQIKLNNTKMSKIDTRNVLMHNISPDDDLLELEEKINDLKSILSFTLPPKDFKDTITDIVSYCDKVRLEKHGNGPLVLIFSKAHTNNCETEYTDPDKIELSHTLTENQSYKCEFLTTLLKSISVSIANSPVKIKCMENNEAIISYNIEDIITFNINPKRL